MLMGKLFLLHISKMHHQRKLPGDNAVMLKSYFIMRAVKEYKNLILKAVWILNRVTPTRLNFVRREDTS